MKMGLGKYSLAIANATSPSGVLTGPYFVTKFLAQRRCFVGVRSVMRSFISEK